MPKKGKTKQPASGVITAASGAYTGHVPPAPHVPIVAIVGRPNVGKSTLFNKLVGSRMAIVDDMPGVTRDRNISIADIYGHRVNIVDTGGFELSGDLSAPKPLIEQIREQAQLAIEEADLILFVASGPDGLTDTDHVIAETLRKTSKDLILAINKIDHEKHDAFVPEFYELGLEPVIAISAEHSSGLSLLRDSIVAGLKNSGAWIDEPEQSADDELSGEDEPAAGPAEPVRIAVVGRPNTGKSSLINALLGQPRMMVSELAGTTRDSVDSLLESGGKKYILIDTAGIRRKGKVSERVEKFSVIKALRSIERADIAILLVDASTGIAEQDLHVAGYVTDEWKGLIICVNKWDIAPEGLGKKEFADTVRHRLKFVPYAPVMFVSALKGEGVGRILDEAGRVWEESGKRFPTSFINDLLEKYQERNSPPLDGGKRVKFYFAAQTGTNPVTIRIDCNRPQGVHFAYRRYLVNQFRDSLGLHCTPLKLVLRKKER